MKSVNIRTESKSVTYVSYEDNPDEKEMRDYILKTLNFRGDFLSKESSQRKLEAIESERRNQRFLCILSLKKVL